jgi:alanine dehydrogenase
LTNVTLQHGLELADHGEAVLMDPDTPLGRGLNTWQGQVTHEAVASALKLPFEAR